MSSVDINMLHSMKPFVCPNCNASYSSQDSGRCTVPRFPRILTCFHSVCDRCIQDSAKYNRIICPLCKEETDLSENNGILKLQPDVHALGVLCVNMRNSLPSLKARYIHHVPFRKQNEESLKKSVSSFTCGYCNKNDAQWQCDECQYNFCSVCFEDAHSKDKFKKKHEAKKIFADKYNSMVQEGCPEHENKTVEFYCEVDDHLTCSFCMLMGDHVGHEVKTLLDKNKSCADALRNSLIQVAQMEKRLKNTDHTLCNVIPKEKIDVSNLLKEVHDHFHKLHAILQKRESELINELTDISEGNTKPLEELRLKVTGLEKDLAAARQDAEAVINNPHLAISAPALLKKLEDSENLPCYLVPICENDTDSKYVNIDLELNSELEIQLKQFGKIKCNIKPKYKLMPANELPSSFVIPEIPEDFDVITNDSGSCATSIDNFSEDSLSLNSNFSGIQASLKCKDITRMTPEKVSVTHIKSPSSFFVQKFSDARKLKQMCDAIDKYCKQNNDGKKRKSNELIPGDLYLVKYKVDNRWYRGRIKKIIDRSEMLEDDKVIGKTIPMVTEGGRIVSVNKDVKVEVFYIDFGNTEVVPMYNIINIQPRFFTLPSLAKECSLVDINPIKGTVWSDECIKTFAKIVENKQVIMQIYEERNNVYFVDLCQSADSDIACDTPVSVRDALVFLELAVFPANIKPKIMGKRNKAQRKYMPPESLKVNTNICGIVSHVENPDSIYVQQMSTASYLSNLIFEMNETYNKDSNPLLHCIYVPFVGMICAAQFTLDKQWYRAQVIGLPGGATVEVQYVDFGNTEVIHHKHLRKLFDRFLKLNIQAIPCRLAHVSYNQEKCWSPKAKEWLTNEVSRKQLTIKSLGVIPGINKSEVVLYFSDDEFDICINSLMVKNGFATATGPFGSTEVKVKKAISLPKEKEEMSKAIAVPNQVSIPEPPYYIDEPGPFIPPPISTPHKHVHADPAKVSTKYPTLATPMLANAERLIEVYVSHIETPGCYYIRIAGETEKKLNLLMQEMQKTYDNLDYEVIECIIGNMYAAYSEKQKKWFRGTILSELPDDKFEVQFIDYGNTKEVDKRNLRKLIDKFTTEDPFAKKCYLDSITPTGGSLEWSRTACDAFQRIVDKYEIFLLSRKGNSANENPIPTDLLIENLIKGGALEPDRLEFISITQEIIHHGLGLPVRRRKKIFSDMEDMDEVKKDSNIDIPATSKTNWTDQVKNCEENSVTKTEEESIQRTKEENVPVPVLHQPVLSQPVLLKSTLLEPVLPVAIPKPTEPKFQWKPAILPIDPSFKGYVTNIGEDGTIHLNVLKEGSSQVDIIKKALQFKFSKGGYEPLKEPPPIGEACIAKFSVDNFWYRAEVLSVYPNQAKVNFVDYGNNEIVSFKDIRQDIIMHTFPRQCIECCLEGVDDKLKWDNDITTFLHNQLVETEVMVQTKGPTKDGRLPCEIKMMSGIDVADLLLSMGFDDEYADSLKERSASQTDLDCFKTFNTPQELREGDMFPVCVTQVPAPNIVYLQRLKIPDPKDDYEKKHNEQYDLFLELIADLRQRADSFPKLKEPLPGMPCCAKYSYDDSWYRCEITDLTEDGAVVLYVDYGNTETVSFEDLRKLEDSFIEFPLQLHFCELHGLKPVEQEFDSNVHIEIIKKLLVPEQDFLAKVVVPGQISKIDILTEIDGEYKLVYEDLIKDKLVTLEK